MKRIIWICLVVLFIVPTLSQAGITGPANIRFVDGDVMFRTPDDAEWLYASINTPVDEGDSVWCPDGSRVEIQLPDGTMIRLDGGSQLDLLANTDGFTHLHLASGRLYLMTSQISGIDSLQIDAADTTVLPAARTRLGIDMLPDSHEDVAIFEGTAYVEGNGNRTNVHAGEQITLDEGQSEILPLYPEDSWETWNMERDRAQSRSARSDYYLPDELRDQAADLDTNGTWVRVPDYGMVWRPTVILSDDWAPYRAGRWIWKGDDYVWVSDENWGCVPYHYGRWAVVAGIGWCWVPPARGDVYWGPGYVGWYTTGSLVGWTPLAPGEIFYGHRRYGRNSAIISNVNVNPATVVYRNRYTPGGLSVVRQNDFLRGRTVIQRPTRTTSFSVSVSIGSPRIKPLRETRMPVTRQPTTRVAPPRIEYRDSRELRTRFPRLAPASNPVFRRPQSTPATSVPIAPPPVHEKQPVYPAVLPHNFKTDPGARPHDVPAKRDGYVQPPAALRPVPQLRTAVPGNAPQRPERPQRGNTPGMAPSETTPQRGERAPKEVKQKKVWKVTTPDKAGDREKEHKEKERR